MGDEMWLEEGHTRRDRMRLDRKLLEGEDKGGERGGELTHSYRL